MIRLRGRFRTWTYVEGARFEMRPTASWAPWTTTSNIVGYRVVGPACVGRAEQRVWALRFRRHAAEYAKLKQDGAGNHAASQVGENCVQDVLPLANAELRFVPCTDGRPEGLSELDIRTDHPAEVLEAGERRGLRTGDAQVTIGGVRLNLVP